MQLTLEETRILLTATCRLENEYRKKENDLHGQPVSKLRERNRKYLKDILSIQRKLICNKDLLEISE